MNFLIIFRLRENILPSKNSGNHLAVHQNITLTTLQHNNLKFSLTAMAQFMKVKCVEASEMASVLCDGQMELLMRVTGFLGELKDTGPLSTQSVTLTKASGSETRPVDMEST